MSVETKKRGRPRTEPSDALEPDQAFDARSAWRVRDPVPAGPRCGLCNQPTQRSETVLKAYKMNALRCLNCKSTAIETDTQWFDLETAAQGAILNRARVLFGVKYPAHDLPTVGDADLHGMMFSEDERWESESL